MNPEVRFLVFGNNGGYREFAEIEEQVAGVMDVREVTELPK